MSHQMMMKVLITAGLALALSSSRVPEAATTHPLQIQPRILKPAFPEHFCLDCKTGPFTTIGPTARRPVKLQVDPHTGRLFVVP